MHQFDCILEYIFFSIMRLYILPNIISFYFYAMYRIRTDNPALVSEHFILL